MSSRFPADLLPSLEGRGQERVRRKRARFGVRKRLAALAHPAPTPPFQGGGALCALLLLLAACDREERALGGQPRPETRAYVASGDPRSDEYQNNAFQLAQGGRLYAWMNCVGCHAHGGGGMGPPLMDEEWRYGGRMEDIVHTILKGRPNGMPSFEGKITEQQAWQLAAYVRSLSAQPRQDALPGRADEMSNIEPPVLSERERIEAESNETLPRDERD
jgi:cytochrome c oxidase cbb3-type subunit 3